MHAVVINVTFTDRAAATRESGGLCAAVLERAPGFVAGPDCALAGQGHVCGRVRLGGVGSGVHDDDGVGPADVGPVDSAEVGEVMAHA